MLEAPPWSEPSQERKRRVFFALGGLLFVVLVWRLFTLQILGFYHYRELSEENRIRILPLNAPRGEIIDRKGRALALNRPSYVISVIPGQLKSSDHFSPWVLETLGLNGEDIRRKVEEQRSYPFQPVKVKRDVPLKTVCYLEEQSSQLMGFIYQVEPRREYPHGPLGAHLLGYVGQLSKSELERLRERGYRHEDVVGKKGLEREYERFLKGLDGAEYVEVTARGRQVGRLEGKGPIPPILGSRLELAIDLDLQRRVEELLLEAGHGAAVALDPRNGEVLALASVPRFDPNMFSSVTSQEQWQAIYSDPSFPLLNRAIQGLYPPGSTMKIVTAGAALERGKISVDTEFSPCRGDFRYGDRWFGCWKEDGHGALNLHQAIVHSCDIYFYQVGLRLGTEEWARFVLECGFGVPTGIDLPNEEPGSVPTPDYLDKRYGRGKWGKGLILNFSIGQGEILVTPLQMAVFVASLANGGTIYRPQVVRSIISPQRKVVEIDPKVVGHLPFSASTIRVLQRALVGAVNEPQGTGRLAGVEGIMVAGKTGTAQNPHGEDHAWFIGYAPADDPRIAVALVVENAGHGGSVAAPMVGDILEAFLLPDEVPWTRDDSDSLPLHGGSSWELHDGD